MGIDYPTGILTMNHWRYLDGTLVLKISKHHFVQDIQNFFHDVAHRGLEPHKKNFWKNISTNMVARGIGSFGTLGGAVDLLIECCQKKFCQYSANMW